MLTHCFKTTIRSKMLVVQVTTMETQKLVMNSRRLDSNYNEKETVQCINLKAPNST